MLGRKALLVGLLACPTMVTAQVRDTVHPPKPAPTPTTRRSITITFTDFAFDAPDTVLAGVTTFHAINKGAEQHQATLVRLDSSKTVADLLAALRTPGPLPGWATLYGGPQNASTVMMGLPPGNYVWICLMPGADGVMHFAKGMVRPLTVVAAKGIGAAPAPSAVVTATDYTWTISKPILAGRRVLRVVTSAKSQPHEVVIMRLAPGKTAQDVLAWSAHPAGPPPAVSVEGVAALGPKMVNYAAIDFKRGHYLFICFFPDAKDGKTHAAHGMVKDVVVR